MKLIKGAVQLLIAWAILLFLLFGTTIVNYVGSSSTEIKDSSELNKYSGYQVKKLKNDWFGNWVIAKKGRDEVAFKCSDSIFAELSVEDQLGQ